MAAFRGNRVMNRILACTNRCWKWWFNRVHRSRKTEALGKALMRFWGKIRETKLVLSPLCFTPIWEDICWKSGGSSYAFCHVFRFTQSCVHGKMWETFQPHCGLRSTVFFRAVFVRDAGRQAVLCSNGSPGAYMWGAEYPLVNGNVNNVMENQIFMAYQWDIFMTDWWDIFVDYGMWCSP